MITVIRPSLQGTVQDVGRRGLGHLGVPRSGAADRVSLTLANRIVGNDESTAALEFLMGNFAIRFEEAAAFALTGAPLAARLAGRPVALATRTYARPGDVLVGARPPFGLRSYVAFSGGIDVPLVLGSRSSDSLSGLGPKPLEVGDTLAVGAPSSLSRAPVDCPLVMSAPPSQLDLTFTWGPRDDWFTSEAQRIFVTTVWLMSHEMDRIAARLSGPRLQLVSQRQLPTEGLHLGSVQVPPSGQPIIHLANHPPTGGYPVIGVVEEEHVWRLAQCRPSTAIKFLPRM